MLSDAQVEFIAEGCEDMELDSIWDYFSSPFGNKFMSHGLDSFEERREGFLWVLGRLIEQGKIVLVETVTHAPLQGNVESQIRMFREAFPPSDEAMDAGLWFFSSNCPGGAAWKK